MLRAIRSFFARDRMPADSERNRESVGASLPVRARYDAAQTNDGNRRHWAFADGLSANAAANPEVRRTLRNRSRYEIANNSFARGMVETLANDAVGTGPRLQMNIDGRPQWNTAIESRFAEWAEAVDLAEKLRVARKAKVVDGEAILILASNPGVSNPVTLDVVLYEADQLTSPTLFAPQAGKVDGITFDRFGNPLEYHILRDHPGSDSASGLGVEYDAFPAANVIHWFRSDRAGQSRGLPEMMAALPLFSLLRRYTLAVLGAAETAADFAGVLQSDAPPEDGAEDVAPMEAIELEAKALLTLPAGWKMGQMKAEQPTTGHAAFMRTILTEIGRCVHMPYNIAAGDSSGYNYASGRLDHQTYAKSLRVEQGHLSRCVLNRIFRAWLAEAVLISDYLPRGARAAIPPTGLPPHQWFFDGMEHVDPTKSAQAESIQLKDRTLSLSASYARRGLDWEKEVRQIAREKALLDSLGLTIQDVASAPQPQPAEKAEGGDDAEDE